MIGGISMSHDMERFFENPHSIRLKKRIFCRCLPKVIACMRWLEIWQDMRSGVSSQILKWYIGGKSEEILHTHTSSLKSSFVPMCALLSGFYFFVATALANIVTKRIKLQAMTKYILLLLL